MTQLQPIAVIFTLPEDQLPQVLKLVRGGHKLVVEAFDRSETTHLASGTLLTVDNQIDTTTGTVKAKAVFDNKDGALFPNQFVNVRLILEQRANSLVMPASAMQTGNGGSFVYVVKQGDAAAQRSGNGWCGQGRRRHGKRRGTADGGAGGGGGGKRRRRRGAGSGRSIYVDVQNVVMDLTEGSQVILKRGVNAGDQIVMDGQEKLKKYSR